MKLAALLTLIGVAGCAGSGRQTIVPLGPSPAVMPTSQPGSDVSSVVAQQQGAINALVEAQADLRADLDIQATATGVDGDITGYISQFGVGPILITGSALVLTLILSHRREMARIKGKDNG